MPKNTSMTYQLLASLMDPDEILPGAEIVLKPDAAVFSPRDTDLLLSDQFSGKSDLPVYMINNQPPIGAGISPEQQKNLEAKGVLYIGPNHGGISPMVLAEEGLAFPGALIAGTDEALSELGVLGAFYINIDGSQAESLLKEGKFRFMVPQVTSVKLHGSPAEWTSGTDIALSLLKYYKLPGSADSCLEFSGEGLKALSLAERHNLLRTMSDFGYHYLLCESDEESMAFLQDRSEAEARFFFAVETEKGLPQIDLDISRISLMIARAEKDKIIISELLDLDGKKIDQVIIGGDTACRYEDVEKGLKLIGYNPVPEEFSALLMPGTQLVTSDLLDTGIAGILTEIGFQIFPSSFLSLLEADPGNTRMRLCTSAKMLRQGAMLTNAAVCFAAASRGYIIHPEELKQSLPEKEEHTHEKTDE